MEFDSLIPGHCHRKTRFPNDFYPDVSCHIHSLKHRSSLALISTVHTVHCVRRHVYTYCANDIINDLYSLSFLTCDVYMFVHACCYIVYTLSHIQVKWSRKGFLHTRWRLFGRYIILHLYVYMYRRIYVYLLTCYMKTCVTLFIYLYE